MVRRSGWSVAALLLLASVGVVNSIKVSTATWASHMKPKGKQANPWVLPLASPLGRPEIAYIPPWSFGNEQWDPISGAAGTFGPHSDMRSSYVKPGEKVPFPPGTPPDMNPMLYMHPNAQVTAGAFLQVDSAVREALSWPSGEPAEGTTGGDGVGRDNNKGYKGVAPQKGTPSWVMPLAAPMNKPEQTYLPPWAFAGAKWDLNAEAPVGTGPKADMSDAFQKPGQTTTWAQNTPPDQNPNEYIQPPPYGARPNGQQVYEDRIVNHPEQPREVGPTGIINGHPVYPRYINQDMLPEEDRIDLPPGGLDFGPIPKDHPMGQSPVAVALIQTEALMHRHTQQSRLSSVAECVNCVYLE